MTGKPYGVRAGRQKGQWYEIKTLHCGSSDGGPDDHMLTRSEHLRG